MKTIAKQAPTLSKTYLYISECFSAQKEVLKFSQRVYVKIGQL